MSEKSTFKISVLSRLKHGALREALVKRGWTQTKAAEYIGMHQNDFCRLINLKHVPKFTKQQEEKLMELTNQTMEDLFPPEVRSAEFLGVPKTSESSVEVPLSVLLCARTTIQLPSPDHALERKELSETLNTMIETLSYREKFVINGRYKEGKSWKEMGRELGITDKGVRAIEDGALLKLRSPSRERFFKEMTGADQFGEVLDVIDV